MKVTVLCHNLSNNALGRAGLLASVLAPRHAVKIVGPVCSGEIWQPMQNSKLEIVRFPWKRFPEFRKIEHRIRAAIDGDVMIACKLRTASFGIAVKHRRLSGTPLLTDIDDWELGLQLIKSRMQRLPRWFKLTSPDSLPYVWWWERQTEHTDAITVSNRFLQNRFGGELLRHGRDTRTLDPEAHSGTSVREALGLRDKKVVMFLGTPRAHKGLDTLKAAFRKLNRPDSHLLIVGANVNAPQTDGRMTLHPEIAFEALPTFLSAADIMVIPQGRNKASLGQLPVKLLDAMAMAKPTISTNVSDIPEVLGGAGYIVEPDDSDALAGALEHVLNHPEEARAKGVAARTRCRELYDTSVLAEQLNAILENLRSRALGRGTEAS